MDTSGSIDQDAIAEAIRKGLHELGMEHRQAMRELVAEVRGLVAEVRGASKANVEATREGSHDVAEAVLKGPPTNWAAVLVPSILSFVAG